MKFKTWIEENGLKRSFVAAKIGVNTQTLANILKRGTNDIRKIMKIAQLTKGAVNALDLTAYEPEKKQSDPEE